MDVLRTTSLTNMDDFLEIFQTSLSPFLSEKSVANFQENVDISVFHGFILWSNVASNLQHNSLDGK